MMPIPYWWLASLLCCACVCQAPNESGKDEDLQPIQSALTYHTPGYHLKLREVLMTKAPHGPPVQLLILPSFHPETLVTLYATTERVGPWKQVERTGFEAQVVRPSESIWEHRGAADEVKCTVAKRQVSGEIAERLTDLWRGMLLRTRHSSDRKVHLDGVSYYFTSWKENHGTWSGMADNPAEGSRPYVLAEIGKSLIEYVEADSAAEKEALSLLTKQMDALEALLAAPEDRPQKARPQGGDGDVGRKPDLPAVQLGPATGASQKARS